MNKLNIIFFLSIFCSQNDFGKDDYGGEEVHEVFIKKHAYQTGTGFGNFKFPSFGQRSSSSSASSSSSSSSGSGYGANNPSQATSYSSSSSWSSGSGQPPLAPFDQSGYGRSSIPLAKTGEKMCTNKPKAILNASTKCSLVTKSCIVQCLNNYQLPNGESKAKIYCNAGEWALENLEWTDKLACERE